MYLAYTLAMNWLMEFDADGTCRILAGFCEISSLVLICSERAEC